MIYQGCIELLDGSAILSLRHSSVEGLHDDLNAMRRKYNSSIGAVTTNLGGDAPNVIFKSVNYRSGDMGLYVNNEFNAKHVGWGTLPDHCYGDTENSKYVTHDTGAGRFLFHDIPARYLSYGGFVQ